MARSPYLRRLLRASGRLTVAIVAGAGLLSGVLWAAGREAILPELWGATATALALLAAAQGPLILSRARTTDGMVLPMLAGSALRVALVLLAVLLVPLLLPFERVAFALWLLGWYLVLLLAELTQWCRLLGSGPAALKGDGGC